MEVYGPVSREVVPSDPVGGPVQTGAAITPSDRAYLMKSFLWPPGYQQTAPDETPVRHFRMGQILRLFTAMPAIGCAAQLAKMLGTVSPDVVRGHPGCLGWAAFAPCHQKGPHLFMSLWASTEAVIERFGADWQEAHLPEGYAELIEWCSLEHFDLLGKQLLDGSVTRTPP